MDTQANTISRIKRDLTNREVIVKDGLNSVEGLAVDWMGGRHVTVKSRLSERQLSEITGLFEDEGQSQLFFQLSIAIKLPIIRILIIRKIQFFEVIRQSRLMKLLFNYPSRFVVQISHMVIMISLFGRVPFTHPSDLANTVATGN